jgi:hypothetical protein
MVTQYAGLLTRYKHLRRLGLGLNNRLTETLTRDDLDEGGKKLGILKRGVLALDTEDEIAVLMDYCIHDVRRRGVNAVERYLASPPVTPESDELILLQALRQARYSLYTVESADPGVAVHVRDLLRDEPLFLVDVGLSRSATVGMILASRVMAPDGIGMTTGAALPAGVLSPSRRTAFLAGLTATFGGVDFRHPSSEEASELAAAIIRACLRQGAAERVAYVEPGQRSRPGSMSQALAPAHRVGRNDPCPCGSGRTFKRCCGRRQ